jgi:DNA repair photolyase
VSGTIRVEELDAKSILVPSKLPDADFVLNPYIGCAIGCQYCYASFMGRFVGESIATWGEYVYVKRNAVELLRKDLESLRRRNCSGTILLSSVTDPYQPVEATYRLSRGLIEVLADVAYPDRIGVLTKSPMVTRDIDVLQQLPNVEVGMTVTTTDNKLARWLEVRAPSSSKRLAALRKLAEARISTYAFVGPLIPDETEQLVMLDELFKRIADSGVRSVFVERMSVKPYLRQRLKSFGQDGNHPLLNSQTSATDDVIKELLERNGLELRLGNVLRHGISDLMAPPP